MIQKSIIEWFNSLPEDYRRYIIAFLAFTVLVILEVIVQKVSQKKPGFLLCSFIVAINIAMSVCIGHYIEPIIFPTKSTPTTTTIIMQNDPPTAAPITTAYSRTPAPPTPAPLHGTIEDRGNYWVANIYGNAYTINKASGMSAVPVDMTLPILQNKSYSHIFSGANSSYDMNINIYWVQTQLKTLGYYYGDLTGLFDYNTDNAVRQFMKSIGYSYSSKIDQEVVNLIFVQMGCRPSQVLYGGYYHYMDYLITDRSQTGHMNIIWSNINHDIYGSDPNTPFKHSESGWVQYALKELGYYKSKIDLMFGEGTDAAVQSFEKSNGFTVKQDRHVYVTYGEARKMLERCYYANVSMSGFSNYQ